MVCDIGSPVECCDGVEEVVVRECEYGEDESAGQSVVNVCRECQCAYAIRVSVSLQRGLKTYAANMADAMPLKLCRRIA